MPGAEETLCLRLLAKLFTQPNTVTTSLHSCQLCCSGTRSQQLQGKFTAAPVQMATNCRHVSSQWELFTDVILYTNSRYLLP